MLQADLVAAGFDPNLYNPDFTRNEKVSGERNIGQEKNLPDSVSSAVQERDAVDQTIQKNLE